ncbi:MAG TPA: 30S ribosomal protein S12 methylthiotransferase RimO [Terriglobales bacterium]|nr:30S ribosomal protein S12 methylthiotransferase RimO [Terriglobales bacterium]
MTPAPPHDRPPLASRRKTVALVSLGCAKNLVDSEVMLGALKASGYAPITRPRDAAVVIVNTCGFIRPAREEAEKALSAALRLKKRDPAKTVVAAGCYVERWGEELRRRFPEVDVWTGVRDFDRIAGLLAGRLIRGRDGTFLCTDRSPRLVSTPGPWAYVKISEGCSHHCGFCAIPLIKGPYISRSVASVVREARALAAQGVKEVDLISHDTTFYGRDRGERHGLVRLVERLLGVPGLEWIRLLYGYPEEVTDDLLGVMTEAQVCRYLDLPFQHADPAIVRAMGRGLDGDRALELLERIRVRLPGVAVRTSLIVGFPGEGRREFAALLRFVLRARFDHLGVFAYSPEEGTRSFASPGRVREDVKERRRAEVMALQAEISRARNRSYTGRVLDVLVEAVEPPAGGRRVLEGRTRFQAPEVDGRVRVSLPLRASLPARPIVRAKITSAGRYDLRAELVP